MKSKKKEKLTMVEVTKGYEVFIKRKEVNNNSKELFNRVIEKAAKTKTKKLRGSK